MDYPSIFDMEQDIKDFIANQYDSSLPPHTSEADIRVLWVAADRMTMLKKMSEKATSQKEYDLFLAVYDDFELIFLGFMHAIGMKSLEIQDYRQQLAEKNAMANLDNIDALAS